MSRSFTRSPAADEDISTYYCEYQENCQLATGGGNAAHEYAGLISEWGMKNDHVSSPKLHVCYFFMLLSVRAT